VEPNESIQGFELVTPDDWYNVSSRLCRGREVNRNFLEMVSICRLAGLIEPDWFCQLDITVHHPNEENTEQETRHERNGKK